MDKIISSIKKFRLTKDIKDAISTINPSIKSNDLSALMHQLYREELIGEVEYLTIETKVLLNRFCLLMEQKFSDLYCGVYLYDEQENKIWNGAVPHLPEGYNEYSNGCSVENDIVEGEEIPVSIQDILAVSDVERAEDITSLNHKKDILKHGLHAFCTSPLSYSGQSLGHTVMFSKQKRPFTNDELIQFSLYNRFIEEQLFKRKEQLLDVIKKSNLA
ncbi:hypothetical protein LCL95_00820 [Bacillus timonensis]|nr:hypothetical protein [Bacillus timonensis]